MRSKDATITAIDRLLWISALEMLAWEIERLFQGRERRIKIFLEVMRLTAEDQETVH